MATTVNRGCDIKMLNITKLNITMLKLPIGDQHLRRTVKNMPGTIIYRTLMVKKSLLPLYGYERKKKAKKNTSNKVFICLYCFSVVTTIPQHSTACTKTTPK